MLSDSAESKNFKKPQGYARWLLVSFVALCIFWAAAITICYLKSHTMFTYSGTPVSPDDKDNQINVTMDVSKSWKDISLHYDTPYGAQYDYMLFNNTDYPLKDYTVEVHMSEEMFLDSGWNGAYEMKGKDFDFTGENPLNIIPAQEGRPFGAVMYSAAEPEFESFVIRGYWDVSLKNTGWYWILIELSTAFVAFLIFTMIDSERRKRDQAKMEKDERIIEQSMKTLTGFIDAKDAYTKDHSIRVAEYAREIARRAGIDDEHIRYLFFISLMHDCGKISIPDEILKKEGVLTPDEFNVIKTHPTRGNELLKRFTEIEGIGDGAHYHHERYDGFGYPSGLEGEEIPLCARIICVADSYDAMSSDRCYRKALSKEVILKELENNSGKQFDPKFVPIMIEMIEDGFTDKVKEKYN